MWIIQCVSISSCYYFLSTIQSRFSFVLDIPLPFGTCHHGTINETESDPLANLNRKQMFLVMVWLNNDSIHFSACQWIQCLAIITYTVMFESFFYLFHIHRVQAQVVHLVNNKIYYGQQQNILLKQAYFVVMMLTQPITECPLYGTAQWKLATEFVQSPPLTSSNSTRNSIQSNSTNREVKRSYNHVPVCVAKMDKKSKFHFFSLSTVLSILIRKIWRDSFSLAAIFDQITATCIHTHKSLISQPL